MRVDNLEQKISRIEGFSIVIRDRDGRDVRSDSDIPSPYDCKNQGKNNWTVSEWKERRFKPRFAGYEVDVLMGDEQVAPGQTTLSTVRDSYLLD